MKKIILTLATMMMLAVSSVCSATPGKVLDAEDVIVAKLFAAKDYKSVEALFSEDFKKDFNAASFDNFKKSFGAFEKSKLLSINKYDEADEVVYITAFEKMPNVLYAFIFEVKNEKPLLAGMQFRVVEKEEAQGTAPEAGK